MSIFGTPSNTSFLYNVELFDDLANKEEDPTNDASSRKLDGGDDFKSWQSLRAPIWSRTLPWNKFVGFIGVVKVPPNNLRKAQEYRLKANDGGLNSRRCICALPVQEQKRTYRESTPDEPRRRSSKRESRNSRYDCDCDECSLCSEECKAELKRRRNYDSSSSRNRRFRADSSGNRKFDSDSVQRRTSPSNSSGNGSDSLKRRKFKSDSPRSGSISSDSPETGKLPASSSRNGRFRNSPAEKRKFRSGSSENENISSDSPEGRRCSSDSTTNGRRIYSPGNGKISTGSLRRCKSKSSTPEREYFECGCPEDEDVGCRYPGREQYYVKSSKYSEDAVVEKEIYQKRRNPNSESEDCGCEECEMRRSPKYREPKGNSENLQDVSEDCCDCPECRKERNLTEYSSAKDSCPQNLSSRLIPNDYRLMRHGSSEFISRRPQYCEGKCLGPTSSQRKSNQTVNRDECCTYRGMGKNEESVWVKSRLKEKCPPHKLRSYGYSHAIVDRSRGYNLVSPENPSPGFKRVYVRENSTSKSVGSSPQTVAHPVSVEYLQCPNVVDRGTNCSVLQPSTFVCPEIRPTGVVSCDTSRLGSYSESSHGFEIDLDPRFGQGNYPQQAFYAETKRHSKDQPVKSPKTRSRSSVSHQKSCGCIDEDPPPRRSRSESKGTSRSGRSKSRKDSHRRKSSSKEDLCSCTHCLKEEKRHSRRKSKSREHHRRRSLPQEACCPECCPKLLDSSGRGRSKHKKPHGKHKTKRSRDNHDTSDRAVEEDGAGSFSSQRLPRSESPIVAQETSTQFPSQDDLTQHPSREDSPTQHQSQEDNPAPSYSQSTQGDSRRNSHPTQNGRPVRRDVEDNPPLADPHFIMAEERLTCNRRTCGKYQMHLKQMQSQQKYGCTCAVGQSCYHPCKCGQMLKIEVLKKPSSSKPAGNSICATLLATCKNLFLGRPKCECQNSHQKERLVVKDESVSVKSTSNSDGTISGPRKDSWEKKSASQEENGSNLSRKSDRASESAGSMSDEEEDEKLLSDAKRESRGNEKIVMAAQTKNRNQWANGNSGGVFHAKSRPKKEVKGVSSIPSDIHSKDKFVSSQIIDVLAKEIHNKLLVNASMNSSINNRSPNTRKDTSNSCIVSNMKSEKLQNGFTTTDSITTNKSGSSIRYNKTRGFSRIPLPRNSSLRPRTSVSDYEKVSGVRSSEINSTNLECSSNETSNHFDPHLNNLQQILLQLKAESTSKSTTDPPNSNSTTKSNRDDILEVVLNLIKDKCNATDTKSDADLEMQNKQNLRTLRKVNPKFVCHTSSDRESWRNLEKITESSRETSYSNLSDDQESACPGHKSGLKKINNPREKDKIDSSPFDTNFLQSSSSSKEIIVRVPLRKCDKTKNNSQSLRENMKREISAATQRNSFSNSKIPRPLSREKKTGNDSRDKGISINYVLQKGAPKTAYAEKHSISSAKRSKLDDTNKKTHVIRKGNDKSVKSRNNYKTKDGRKEHCDSELKKKSISQLTLKTILQYNTANYEKDQTIKLLEKKIEDLEKCYIPACKRCESIVQNLQDKLSMLEEIHPKHSSDTLAIQSLQKKIENLEKLCAAKGYNSETIQEMQNKSGAFEEACISNSYYMSTIQNIDDKLEALQKNVSQSSVCTSKGSDKHWSEYDEEFFEEVTSHTYSPNCQSKQGNEIIGNSETFKYFNIFFRTNSSGESCDLELAPNIESAKCWTVSGSPNSNKATVDRETSGKNEPNKKPVDDQQNAFMEEVRDKLINLQENRLKNPKLPCQKCDTISCNQKKTDKNISTRERSHQSKKRKLKSNYKKGGNYSTRQRKHKCLHKSSSSRTTNTMNWKKKKLIGHRNKKSHWLIRLYKFCTRFISY